MNTPLPDSTKEFAEQKPDVLLAQLLFGEAQNQSIAAKIGVANVVANRVRLRVGFGTGWNDVMLRANAFDCFNLNDPNRNKLMDPLKHAPAYIWDECYGIASAVYGDEIADNTRGAVFYHSPPLIQPPCSVLIDKEKRIFQSKAWGVIQLTRQIDAMSFYLPMCK